MATFYSSLYRENAANSDLFAYSGPYGGRSGETVTVAGTFTCPAALATNDIANLFPVPPGAKVLRYLHYYEDFGTTCTTTVQMGDTDMKASIALGTAVAVGSIAELSAAEVAAAWAANATAEKNLNLIFTSVSTPTAGSVYNFVVTYQVP
jgi:hypothetical protein